MTVDVVAAVAALRGASGVRAFFIENRARLRDLLSALAAPTLLGNDASPSDTTTVRVGLRIESLPLAAQRELWSAFVLWRAALPADALRALVERFLATAETQTSAPADAVCVFLAEELQRTLSGGEDDDDEEDAESGGMQDPDAVQSRLTMLAFVPTLPKSELTKTNEDVDLTTRKRRRASRDELDEGEASPKLQSRTETEVDAPKPTLLPETETRLSAIAAQLALLGSPDVPADQSSRAFELASHTVDLLRQVMDQVHATQQDNEVLFQLACVKLQLGASSDDVLFQVTNGLMDANWSSRYAAIYLSTAVLPRVLSASSVISRVLLQTILLYAKPSYATALTDGLLVPLLSTPSIAPAQGEAATRLLREKCVPADQIDALLCRVLDADAEQRNVLTNEPTILVFQNALNLKPTLSAPTVELLVGAATGALEQESTRAALCKSPKFASLVFTLVTKYSTQCSSHVEELQAVASQLTSVMAKSTLRAIQKLKNP